MAGDFEDERFYNDGIRKRRKLEPLIGVKILKKLDEAKLAEILNAIQQDAPDLISKIRGKLAMNDDEKDDEYLGNELVEFRNFCDTANFTFNVLEYDAGSAFEVLVNSLDAPLAR